MKSWFKSIVSVAALTLPMLAAEAQAGVAGNTYDTTIVSTAFTFDQDAFAFDNSNGVTTSGASGDYIEFDFGVASFFSLTLVDNEDPEFEIDLIGLQIQSIILGRGNDSDGIEYFFFGQNQNQPE